MLVTRHDLGFILRTIIGSVLVIGTMGAAPGIRLSQTPTFVRYTPAAPDGQGGFFLSFTQYCCHYDSNIRLQHVRDDGRLALEPRGLSIHISDTIYGDRAHGYVAPDGSGGAFVAMDWRPLPVQLPRRIEVQHVHAGGQTSVSVSHDSSGWGKVHAAQKDGRGGVGLSWSSGPALYVSVVDSADRLWPQGSVRIGNTPVNGLRMLSDDDGGFIVVWLEDSTLRAQRVTTNGQRAWSESGRVLALYSAEFDIAADGDGGFYVTWTEIGATATGVRVQHLDADGDALWALSGIPVGTGGHPGHVSAAEDTEGVWIAWDEDSGSGGSTHAGRLQHFSRTGTPRWSAEGRRVSDSVEDQRDLEVVSDQMGGAFVAWASGPGTMIQRLFVEHIRADDTGRWAPGLLAVPRSYSLDGQNQMEFVPSTAGSAFLIYRESDLYALRIDDSLEPLVPPTLTASVSRTQLSVGETVNVQWDARSAIGMPRVDVRIRRETGLFAREHVNYLGGGPLPSQGQLSWSVQGPASRAAWFEVSATDPLGMTTVDTVGPLTITDPSPPSITLISPALGDTLIPDSTTTIRWSATNPDGAIAIDIEAAWTGGSTYIAFDTPNDGVESWEVPGYLAAYRPVLTLIARDANGSREGVVSGPLIIAPRSVEQLAVSSPAWGDTLTEGFTTELFWNPGDSTGTVEVGLSRSGRAGPYELLAETLGNTGRFEWVAGAACDSAVLRVTVRRPSGVPSEGFSAPFAIRPGLGPLLAGFPPIDFILTAGGTVKVPLSAPDEIARGTLMDVDFSTTGLSGSYAPVGRGLPLEDFTWTLSSTPTEQGFLRLAIEDRFGNRLTVHHGPLAIRAAPASVDLATANPARGQATFSISLPHATPVRLEILDVAGRLTGIPANGTFGPGRHAVSWATSARSGLYFARLTAAGKVVTRRFVLVR